MSLLVTGSIGIDTVEAPWGTVSGALGGSSVYFSFAASFFCPVRLVGVVGDDCPADFLQPLLEHPAIDTAGLEVRAGSKTFRWHGRYHQDVNLRQTVKVELNVLAEHPPAIPESFRDSAFVFLANTHPGLQMDLLRQLPRARLVVADTMDLWIENEPEALAELLGVIDGLVLNDSEARQLTGLSNVIAAGREIVEKVQARRQGRPGRRGFLVIKKGEHGSVLFADGEVCALPGYPLAKVVDPTGAGDSFAGAMMGRLAASGDLSAAGLRRAMACGTVTASFAIEDFSLNRLRSISRERIDQRLAEFEEMLRI